MKALAFALSLVLVSGSGIGAGAVGASPAALSDALKPMINLKLQDLDGKQFDQGKLKGEVIILDVWATWCGPCIAEIPRLNQLQADYASKGVKVVGLTLMSGAANEVKPFVARRNFKYTILMGNDDQMYDLNVSAFPTTFLITKDWRIKNVYLGAGPRKIQQIESDIQALLK